jgi:carbonic anhydrase
MIDAHAALRKLHEGNHRFVEAGASRVAADPEALQRLAGGQEPFAIVLGCSDSRVPAEIVFDQGIGALFVIRVAGNIVAPSQIGSVEFAADAFGTRLVVVLGHTSCGAVSATVDEVLTPEETKSPNLRSIVDRIRPTVESLVDGQPPQPRDALIERAVRANVRASVDHLRHGSTLLEELVRTDGLLVVGAEYELATGRVDCFYD